MEKIEVGEWIRYKSGVIRKVSRIIPCYENDLLLSDSYYIEFDGKGDISTYKNKQVEVFMKKHSPNIIDLIEVGDYVNGVRVINILYKGEEKIPTSIKCINNCFYEKEIKSIVTKEQFSSVEYRLEEVI